MADFANESNPSIPNTGYPGPIQIKSVEGKDDFARMEEYKAITARHMGQFKKWEDWRRPFESIWKEIYNLFLAGPGRAKTTTRSKVTLPVFFKVIWAALPKIVTIVFGTREWFSVEPVTRRALVDGSIIDALRELLQHQLDLAKFFTKFLEFLQQIFLYGTSYFYVYWKVKREWVTERTPIREDVSFMGNMIAPNELRWEITKTYKVVERRPEIEVLPIEDVYPDPAAKDEENMRGVYVMSSISKAEMKELSTGEFKVYDNWSEVEQTCGDDFQRNQFRQDKRAIRGTNDVPPQEKDSESIDILTFWGYDDLDGDGIREKVHMVWANKILVKAQCLPFEHNQFPIVRGVLFPVPMEWFGMGLCEPVIGLTHELYTIRNQNIDQNNLIINRMWKVDLLADIDLDDLKSTPNGVIKTSNMDAVEDLKQSTIPYDPTRMSEMIQADIEDATAPKSIQGAPSSGALGRTARGAQLIIAQALEKFGLGSKMMEEVNKRILTMMHQLDQQFLDKDDTLYEFYGDVIGDITPEQIRAKVGFRMLGISETVTAEATINQIQAFLNSSQGDPSINRAPLYKKLLSLMKMDVNPDEIILPVSPVMATMADDQAQAQSDPVQAQLEQNGSGGALAIPQQ